jgi:alpha-glucosidase (family GH31 glycosyl hydrolase)
VIGVGRGLPLSVIVVDFFHWAKQGDWSFDSRYWPDPKGMVDEIRYTRASFHPPGLHVQMVQVN